MTRPKTIHNVQKMARAARDGLREQSFALWRDGSKPYQIAKKLKVHERTVGRWIARFRKDGRKAVAEQQRGPAPALGRKLGAQGLKKLDAIIRDKTPDQLKFRFALWSSLAVKEVGKAKFGVDISRRTARRYMHKLGYSYQCPERRAREQDAEPSGSGRSRPTPRSAPRPRAAGPR
jgi:transposase